MWLIHVSFIVLVIPFITLLNIKESDLLHNDCYNLYFEQLDVTSSKAMRHNNSVVQENEDTSITKMHEKGSQDKKKEFEDNMKKRYYHN